jgi:LysM repeat protein/RNA polymerase subunit RPABC4/transcription elongation factor Spt4
MGKRRCRECGAVYEDSFQHCPVCGAEQGRRIPRCRYCGSRLPSGHERRCPICGRQLISFGWVRTLLKLAVVAAIVLFLGATYVYSYTPQLSLPAPTWPPSPTSTATIVLTATATRTRVPPTRTRTPTVTPVPPTPTAPKQVTYVIKEGDSLSVIAEQFGISIEALMIANNLTDRDIIHPDDVLVIPTGTPTPLVTATFTPRPLAPVTRIAIPTSTPAP